MSKEWVEEVESPSEAIQIHTPSLIIQCNIRDDMMGVRYNPTVGANIMSTPFASAYFSNEPLAPTNKALRIAPQSNLKGLGLLHNITIYHDKVKMVLDFHIFDIQDFDIMIGHPLKKLFTEPPKTGGLDVKIGRGTFMIPITQAKKLGGRHSPLP